MVEKKNPIHRNTLHGDYNDFYSHPLSGPPPQLSSPLNVYSTHLIRAPVPDGRDGQSKHDAGPGQGSVVVGPHQVHRVLGGYAALPVGVAGIAVIQ